MSRQTSVMVARKSMPRSSRSVSRVGTGDVAGVDDGVAELLETRCEARQTHGRRPHLDAAPRRAEIEWNAEERNRSHG